jgi:hypothetical protein
MNNHTVPLIGSTITIYDYDLRLRFTITNRTTPYDLTRKCILPYELVTAALWSVDPLIYKWSGDPYSHARYFPKTHSSPTPIYKPDQEANATFSLSHHLLILTHLLHLLHLSTERDYLVLSCLVLSCLSVCVCVFALPHMLLACRYGDTPRRSAILPALLATFSPVWPVSAYSSLTPSPEKRRLPCRLKERETLVRWCGSNPYSSLQRSQLMVRHTMMNN